MTQPYDRQLAYEHDQVHVYLSDQTTDALKTRSAASTSALAEAEAVITPSPPDVRESKSENVR
jgi:hypothetical protein